MDGYVDGWMDRWISSLSLCVSLSVSLSLCLWKPWTLEVSAIQPALRKISPEKLRWTTIEHFSGLCVCVLLGEEERIESRIYVGREGEVGIRPSPWPFLRPLTLFLHVLTKDWNRCSLVSSSSPFPPLCDDSYLNLTSSPSLASILRKLYVIPLTFRFWITWLTLFLYAVILSPWTTMLLFAFIPSFFSELVWTEQNFVEPSPCLFITSAPRGSIYPTIKHCLPVLFEYKE